MNDLNWPCLLIGIGLILYGFLKTRPAGTSADILIGGRENELQPLLDTLHRIQETALPFAEEIPNDKGGCPNCKAVIAATAKDMAYMAKTGYCSWFCHDAAQWKAALRKVDLDALDMLANGPKRAAEPRKEMT